MPRSRSSTSTGSGPGGDARGDARRRRRRLPGRLRRRRLARTRRLPRARRHAVRARELELRGARHEARAHARSRRTSSSSASTTSRSGGSRARSRTRCTSCSAPASRELPAGGVRRVLPAGPVAARRDSSPTSRADRAVPDRALRHLRLHAALRRVVGRGRPPLLVAGISGARSSGSPSPGSRRLPALGEAPAEPAPPGIAAGDVREASASRPGSSSGRANTARDRVRAAPAAAGARASPCCPSRRPATSASTSRATRSGTRTGASSTSGGSSTTSAASHRCGRTTTRPSGPPSSAFVDLVTSGCRVPRAARLPLRALREHRAPAADGPLRHARGRARRPAAREVSSSTSSRSCATALRASRPGYSTQEGRGVATASSAGRGLGRRRVDRRVRGVAGDAASSRCSTRSRLQRGGLRLDAASCTAGCSSSGRRRCASSGAFPQPERAEPKEACGGKAERVERCARRSSSARASRAGARAAARLPPPRAQPRWWEYFHHLELDAEELIEDARHDRRARARRRAGARQAVARLTLTFPPQEHKIGGQDPTTRDRRPPTPLASTTSAGCVLRRGGASRTSRCRER